MRVHRLTMLGLLLFSWRGEAKELENPDFSSERGYYEAPFNLTISCATPDSTVIYTTDGSLPESGSGIQSQNDAPVTLLISQTTIVRAISMKDGVGNSSTKTHSYLFPSDILKQNRPPHLSAELDFEMDQSLLGEAQKQGGLSPDIFQQIPSVSMTVGEGDFFGTSGIYLKSKKGGKAWEKPASFEWIDPLRKKSKQENCGIQIQGGGSRTQSPKQNFKLSFKEVYGKKKLKCPLFPKSEVAVFDTLVLRNPTHDSWVVDQKSIRATARYVNDSWAVETQRAMGHHTPHRRWVHLYLNGFYWGIYTLTERPDAGFASEHFGGEKEDYDVLNSNRLRGGDRERYRKLLELVQQDDVSGEETYAKIQRLIDVNAFIDYLIYNLYSANLDWPYKNYWVVGRRNDAPQFRFFNWDAEMGFFEQWKHPKNPDDFSALHLNTMTVPGFLKDAHGAGFLYRHLRKNPEFMLRLADRFHAYTQQGGVLHPQMASKRYRSLLTEVEPLLALETVRWGDARRTPPYTPWSDEWKALTAKESWLFQQFFPHRVRQLLRFFREESHFPKITAPIGTVEASQKGRGEFIKLSHANDDGVIYYTRDGSDPREGWSSKPTGHLYQGEFERQGSIPVKARVYKNGLWSALFTMKAPQN